MSLLKSPYSPSGPGGVSSAFASPVLGRSQSEILLRPANEEMHGFANSTQFSTTYKDMVKRSESWMKKSSSDFGKFNRTPFDPRMTHGKRASGIDYVAKAAEEFPPLHESSVSKHGTFKRWHKHVYNDKDVAEAPAFNHAYGTWGHKEPPMPERGPSNYVPYTPYNTDRAQGDARPNCFEFRAGYRHSDYPLTKMSTSLTELPKGKKFYSNVHPKEIPNGREWQWTFRSQSVGRLSCNLYRTL
jgi:hypothetical protein